MVIYKPAILGTDFPEDASLTETGFFVNFHQYRVDFIYMGIAELYRIGKENLQRPT